MSTKLFVGRLSDGTTSDDIQTLFRKYGTVTECTVLGNYGFVVSLVIISFLFTDIVLLYIVLCRLIINNNNYSMMSMNIKLYMI